MDESKELEQARWKLVEDLTDRDVELLVKHKGELNQEEQDAFRDVLSASSPFADDPNEVLNQTINQAVDDPQNQDDPNNPQPPVNAQPATPAQPVTPATPAPTVPQTQEQLDAYLEQKRKSWEAEGKTKTEQEQEATKIQQFFDAGYTPKDWNEAAQDMWKKMAPLMEQQIIAKLDKRNAEIVQNQEKIRETQQQVMQRFEGEFDTLSNNGLIPKRDDAQYKAVRDAIWKIGDENGKTTITDAYKLWSIIPVDHGGGLIVDGTTTPSPQQQINRQKQAAGRIRSAAGTVGGKKPGAVPEWHNVHSLSMDELLDKAKTEAGLPV